MAESMAGLKRSCRCAEVTEANVGQEMTLMGWVQKSRNKGGIIFVDLRDRSGILQIIFEESDCGAEDFAKAEKLRSEFVVAVTGRVEARSGAVNENLATGAIEVRAHSMRVLAESETPPFPIEENSKTKEEVTLMPEARNKDELDKLLEDAGISKGSTTIQTSCELTDTELVITKGKTGIGPDMDALKEAILKAISIEDYEAVIECPTMKTPPEELDLEAYYEKVHTDATDASLGENNEIIPAVTGISFDVKSAAKKLEKAKEGAVITIPLEITLPEVSTEEIEALPYLNLLGTYTTYGGGTKNRVANLKLAVEACDGVELQPGQIFSYNDTLGPRTEERGYREATVIVGGEHAQDIGGGICQISTTLFMACLQSDLTIVERHNHAARIDYVEDGLDAAVVWGGQDFRFQNNTAYPIKIEASYDEKEEAVTVSIYGTQTDNNTVEITTEHSDPNTCKTYRSVYDENGTLLRTDEVGYSKYKQ